MTTAKTGNRRKAVDNGDPVALIERVLYRTQRQLDSPGPVSTERHTHRPQPRRPNAGVGAANERTMIRATLIAAAVAAHARPGQPARACRAELAYGAAR
jgi:hypothetical protein